MNIELFLAILGVLFTTFAWYLPDATSVQKAIATLIIVWLLLTIYLALKKFQNLAWNLYGIGSTVILLSLTIYLTIVSGNSNSAAAITFWTLAIGAIVCVVGLIIISSIFFSNRVSLIKSGEQEKFVNRMKNAESIYILGMTLAGLRKLHQPYINNLVSEKKCNLTVVIPSEEIITNHVMKIGLSQHLELYNEYLRTLDWLDTLGRNNLNKVEVRTIPQLPTLSLVIINPDSQNPCLRLAFHVINGSFNNRPWLQFDKKEQPELYKYFVSPYYTDILKNALIRDVSFSGEAKRAQERLQQIGRDSGT